MEIKHKIWLERNGDVIFGQGRESLLKSIQEHKSLSTAAKNLQMSCRLPFMFRPMVAQAAEGCRTI